MDMDTRKRTDDLIIGFYRWPREQLFYKGEATLGQPERDRISRLRGRAFKNPLEGFLLCNTPSELYRLCKRSDILMPWQKRMKDPLSDHAGRLTIFLLEIMWVNHRVIKSITRLDVL